MRRRLFFALCMPLFTSFTSTRVFPGPEKIVTGVRLGTNPTTNSDRGCWSVFPGFPVESGKLRRCSVFVFDAENKGELYSRVIGYPTFFFFCFFYQRPLLATRSEKPWWDEERWGERSCVFAASRKQTALYELHGKTRYIMIRVFTKASFIRGV